MAQNRRWLTMLMSQLQTIVSRRVNPFHRCSLTIGDYEGKSSFNVIKETVHLEGELRFMNNEDQPIMEKYFKKLVKGLEVMFDVKVYLDYITDYPVLNNDEELTHKVEQIKIDNLIVNAPWKTLTRSWFKDGRITNSSLRAELQEVFNKLNELINLAENIHNAKIFYGVENLGELHCNDAIFTILGPDKDFYNTCIANSEKTKEKSSNVKCIETIKVNSLDKEEQYVPGEIKWPEIDSTSAINESSIVFLFEYEGLKILFTGDSGRNGLANAINFADSNSIDLSDTQIIKMPHHGSRHNIDIAFLDRFTHQNRTCYISCTKGDEGHHPSKRLINLLNEKGFKVLSTSGSTLHRSKNAPDRGWQVAKRIECYPTMEKLNL